MFFTSCHCPLCDGRCMKLFLLLFLWSFGQCSCISWEEKKINSGVQALVFFPMCFNLKQWWFSLPHRSLRCCHSWTGGLALSLKNFIVKEKSGGSPMKNFNHPVCSPFEGGTIVPIVTTTVWEKGQCSLPQPQMENSLCLDDWKFLHRKAFILKSEKKNLWNKVVKCTNKYWFRNSVIWVIK